MKQLNVAQILTAMAQVFADYPDRHTTNIFRRTISGNVAVQSDPKRQTYSMCAVGFLFQAIDEKLITVEVNLKAQGALGAACKSLFAFDTDGTIYKSHSDCDGTSYKYNGNVTAINDADGGRLNIIKAAKHAAAVERASGKKP